MKKLLSSLIIFTLIISSFSCVAFADGEKTWNLALRDFSTGDQISTNSRNTGGVFNSLKGKGWFGADGKYEYNAQEENVRILGDKGDKVATSCALDTDKIILSENDAKYMVIKMQMKGNAGKDYVSAIFYNSDSAATSGQFRNACSLFEISDMSVAAPKSTAKDNFGGYVAINDYYNDTWIDYVAVIDMDTSKTNFPAVIYANGQKLEGAYEQTFKNYITDPERGMLGIWVKGNWAGTGNTYLDNTAIYTVDKSDLPNLTLSQNNLKFTTSNEVTLANLSKDATLSLVKVNGNYLPLSAIKTEKGGLAFNVSEDVLAYGNNTIDLSEVKDIFGQAPTGNATFTVEKPYPQVEVANSTVAAYEDGEGTYTNRFFKLIEKAEDYAKVVFEITSDGFTWTVDLDEVYGNVTVNDTVYSKTGVYVATAAIGDVPSDDVEFSVNAYAVDFEGVSIPLN